MLLEKIGKTFGFIIASAAVIGIIYKISQGLINFYNNLQNGYESYFLAFTISILILILVILGIVFYYVNKELENIKSVPEVKKYLEKKSNKNK